MTMMLAKTYEAFCAAGVPEDKAQAAAEELAGYENRFAKLEADMLVVKWMLGLLLAGVASLVIKAFLL
ncbi:MAG: integrase [Gammaproteobacteria bacterium]